MNENGDRPGHLPRLPREYYQGDAMIHWTQSTFDRKEGWLSPLFHHQFRELVLHACVREGMFCPCYCLMEDHIHLLWMGLRRCTDQIRAMAFLRRYLEPYLAPARFQPQAHDRVLREAQRERDGFAKLYSYILSNPVRSGSAARPQDWPYYGAVIPGYPKLDPLHPDFAPLLWRLYHSSREPEAGNLVRPLWGNE